MDAPQLPGAESPVPAAGGHPPGQAAAFRRALDAQVESTDTSTALVPAGPHDLTRPIDVNALRAVLTGDPSPFAERAHTPPAPESVPGFPAAAPAQGSVPAPAAIADMTAVLAAAPEAAPSPNGPTVVVPTVSVPEMHAETTIATSPPKPVGTRGAAGRNVTPAPPSGEEHDRSPRHSGGSGKPSRLPTTIGLSVLLAAIAATALVLIDVGRSSGPLAPSAMPTKSATNSQAAQSPHTAAPTHKPSPSPSHSPSHSPSPSPSTKPSASPSIVASFATIKWTSDYQPLVADIQSRLAKLRYLVLDQGASQYDITQQTMSITGNRWWRPIDDVGFYQNATTSAIRAFKFDYLQHDQGQPPSDGSCDTATYQALVNATN